jgi:hypothetical protein
MVSRSTLRITITAFSMKELDRRIADSEKRGMELVKQGTQWQGDERTVYWAIMEATKGERFK